MSIRIAGVGRASAAVPLAVVMLVLAIATGSRLSGQTAVATVHLTPGWATFGEAVPQGLSHNGLQVGSLPTQTDVKNRWPDGSIRFAIVTVKAPAEASYLVSAAPAASGTLQAGCPGRIGDADAVRRAVHGDAAGEHRAGPLAVRAAGG